MHAEPAETTLHETTGAPANPEASCTGAASRYGRELRQLLVPVTPETFLTEYWQVKPLYIKGTPDKFWELFDRQRFQQAIRRARELSHVPSFRLNAMMPHRIEEEPLTLASMESVTPEEVDELLAQGISICVNDISAADERLAVFARTIKSQMMYLGRVRFNCYVSPDGSGADTHFDARVATTLQIEGRKRWRFSARPAIDWPRSNAQAQPDGTPVWMSPWTGSAEWEHLEWVDEASFMEVVLEPGDVLCLPAGTWHNAKAIGGSLALNLTFSPMGFFDFLVKLLEPVFLEHSGWRGSPPPVFVEQCQSERLPAQVVQYIAERLQELRGFLHALDLQETHIRELWRELTES